MFSAAALRRMDISGCVDRYHAMCMQSDWMLGGCAALSNVSFVRQLGCSSCDPKRIEPDRIQALVAQD